MDKFPFTKEEFDKIYSKVPRLTVELIVKDANGRIFFTKRAIPPCTGQWHLPGGTVYFAETISAAVNRVAKRELGIDVKQTINNGFIEYPSHYKNGLDMPVGLVFEILKYSGRLQPNEEAADSGWFDRIPTPFHADQDQFLIKNKYLIY